MMDVTYLVSYVNSTSSNDASTNGLDKKDKKSKSKSDSLENGEVSERKRANKNGDKQSRDNAKTSKSSSFSHSSSLNGHEAKSLISKTNTSPDLSNSTGNNVKSKRNKSKRKTDKSRRDNSDQAANDSCVLSNEELSTSDKSKSTVISNKSKSEDHELNKMNSHSNLYDFDIFQGKEEDEADFQRSHKSNSLLQSKTHSPTDEHNYFLTVSESEATDLQMEKDFVTPKKKSFKKKRMQQQKADHFNLPASSNNNPVDGPKPARTSRNNSRIKTNESTTHSRGYESERDSLNDKQSKQVPSDSFASKVHSSSMNTISNNFPEKKMISAQNFSNQIDESTGETSVVLSAPLHSECSLEQNARPTSYADIAKSRKAAKASKEPTSSNNNNHSKHHSQQMDSAIEFPQLAANRCTAVTVPTNLDVVSSSAVPVVGAAATIAPVSPDNSAEMTPIVIEQPDDRGRNVGCPIQLDNLPAEENSDTANETGDTIDSSDVGGSNLVLLPRQSTMSDSNLIFGDNPLLDASDIEMPCEQGVVCEGNTKPTAQMVFPAQNKDIGGFVFGFFNDIDLANILSCHDVSFA